VMDRRMRHTSASTILGTVELGNHDVELLGRLLADVSDDGVPKRDTSRLGCPDHAGLVHDDGLEAPNRNTSRFGDLCRNPNSWMDRTTASTAFSLRPACRRQVGRRGLPLYGLMDESLRSCTCIVRVSADDATPVRLRQAPP